MEELVRLVEGEALYIEIRRRSVDEIDLRELLTFFHRYGVDKKQLSVFDRREFSRWFHDEEKYWFAEIFGVKKRGSRKTGGA